MKNEERINELLRLMFTRRSYRSHHDEVLGKMALVRNPDVLPEAEYQRVCEELKRLVRESITPEERAEMDGGRDREVGGRKKCKWKRKCRRY